MTEQILGKRYRIIQLIGKGGMADVYKAKDLKLGRYVAIKVLKEEFYNDEAFVKKFIKEAESTAMLVHPNIVNIYDAEYTDGLYYIVMELANGKNLKEYIKEKGRLSSEEVVRLSIGIAKGLEEAHSLDIIHQDIKPQNIMITENGIPKIMDFGIARSATGETITANTMGSVHYLSPEQARGGYVDWRTDIYSLGITMYEMLTGKLPFKGGNNVNVALMHISKDVPPPKNLVPGIPERLNKIVLKCTARRQIERYQSAEELVDDLLAVFDSSKGQYVQHKKEKKKTSNLSFRKSDEKSKSIGFSNFAVALFIIVGACIAFGFIFAIINQKEPARIEATQTTQSTEKTELNSAKENMKKIPKVTGKKFPQAEKALKKHGFIAMAQYQEGYSEMDNELVVISQYPVAGTLCEEGETVELELGMEDNSYVSIPDVEEESLDVAKSKLKEEGLDARVVYRTSDTIEKDYVISQTPVGGSSVTKGFAVTLIVSQGRSETRVPNLHGMNKDNAVSQLENVGLVLGNIKNDYSGDVGINDVIGQSIEAGTMVPRGTKVSITISVGEKPND